jgi:SH3-like domain-containing protein
VLFAAGRFRIRNAICLGVSALLLAPALARATGNSGRESGLPLPRFVSLKSARVNMRVGPGAEYQVEWMYLKRGLPVEIIQEYDNWRKVRDAEGNEGWVLGTLLSGDRTAIVAPWDRKRDLVDMRAEPQADGGVVARIEPGAVAKIERCANSWCRLELQGISGYVRQSQLWGVYPDEPVNN